MSEQSFITPFKLYIQNFLFRLLGIDLNHLIDILTLYQITVAVLW